MLKSGYPTVETNGHVSSDEENGIETASDDGRSSSPNVPEGQYEVEHVVDYTREGDVEMYLVKWKGWEEEFNTWYVF